jgi:hypothetical protein
MEEETIMGISAVEVYEKLKDRLGSDETKTLLQYLDENLKAGLATKEDFTHLQGEFRQMVENTKAEFKRMEEKFTSAILVSEERTRREIRELETRLLRWLFGMTIGIVAMLLKDFLLK